MSPKGLGCSRLGAEFITGLIVMYGFPGINGSVLHHLSYMPTQVFT